MAGLLRHFSRSEILESSTPQDEKLTIGIRQTKTALIFPGQGSQYPGMGKDLAENFSVAREVFEEADEALGFSISRLCFEGAAEDLQLTENTQPAILTVSVAASRVLQSEGLAKADFLAGHSLGEYSALVASSALSLADAVRTVRSRGRYMQEAVPVGTGAMAAVIGSELSDIESACAEAAQGQVCSAANINAANQIVIAGNTEAVDRAMELLKQRGARRVVKLNVSAPFHCALMMPAQDRLARDLEDVAIVDAETPVVVNVDAQAKKLGADLKAALVRQVSSPVRWQESIELLIKEGVDRFIEVGPGKVLTGLLRQINRDVNGFNVEDSASLAKVRESLLVVG
jgi:[acyl-carrier-protein] S-malonyltransferase